MKKTIALTIACFMVFSFSLLTFSACKNNNNTPNITDNPTPPVPSESDLADIAPEYLTNALASFTDNLMNSDNAMFDYHSYHELRQEISDGFTQREIQETNGYYASRAKGIDGVTIAYTTNRHKESEFLSETDENGNRKESTDLTATTVKSNGKYYGFKNGNLLLCFDAESSSSLRGDPLYPFIYAYRNYNKNIIFGSDYIPLFKDDSEKICESFAGYESSGDINIIKEYIIGFYSGYYFSDAVITLSEFSFTCKSSETKLFIDLKLIADVATEGIKSRQEIFEYSLSMDLDAASPSFDKPLDGRSFDELLEEGSKNILYIISDGQQIYEDILAGNTITINILGGGDPDNFAFYIYTVNDIYKITPENGVITINGSEFMNVIDASDRIGHYRTELYATYKKDNLTCYSELFLNSNYETGF